MNNDKLKMIVLGVIVSVLLLIGGWYYLVYNSLENLMVRGMKSMFLGDFISAAKIYERASDKGSPKASYQAALCYLAQGDIGKTTKFVNLAEARGMKTAKADLEEVNRFNYKLNWNFEAGKSQDAVTIDNAIELINNGYITEGATLMRTAIIDTNNPDILLIRMHYNMLRTFEFDPDSDVRKMFMDQSVMIYNKIVNLKNVSKTILERANALLYWGTMNRYNYDDSTNNDIALDYITKNNVPMESIVEDYNDLYDMDVFR